LAADPAWVAAVVQLAAEQSDVPESQELAVAHRVQLDAWQPEAVHRVLWDVKLLAEAYQEA